MDDLRPSQDARDQILRFLADHPGTVWHVYECRAMDRSTFGSRQYLAIGPDCTYQAPPPVLPDTYKAINHSFLHMGPLDPSTWDVTASG